MEKLHKFVGILLIIFIVMAYLLGILLPSENVKITPLDTPSLENGWHFTQSDAKNPKSSFILQPGEELSLIRIVDKPLDYGTAFAFYDTGFNLKLYVNSRLASETGRVSLEKYGMESGEIWRTIPLSGVKQGDKINIKIENLSNENKLVNLQKFYFCNENFIVSRILRNSVPSIIVCLLCIITAFLLVLFSFAIRKTILENYRSGAIALSGFSLNMGLWVLSDGTFFQLIFQSSSVRYGLSYGSFCLLPYFGLLFYKSMIKRKEKIFSISSIAYVAVVFIILLLNLANIVHISKTIIFVHGFIIYDLILIVVYNLRNYKISKNKADLIPIISVTTLIFACAVGFGIYYLIKGASASIFVGLGYFVFLLETFFMEGSIIVKKISKNEDGERTTEMS